MIKLFVTDLDGCISYAFKTPKWETIHQIRELNIKSRSDENIPPLSICTGRPYPYAEAVAQWLDIRLPFVFESAGVYHWNGNRIETALLNTTDVLTPIKEMKEWMIAEILPNFPSASIEFTKMMDAGIIAHEKEVIDMIIPIVEKKLADDFPDLEMHVTDVSVNILMPGNNKLQGLQLLANALDISLDEIAYIGDTGGDIPALTAVKMPFSPSNATAAVKKVTTNLDLQTSGAVLEAYKRVIDYNRSVN